jgi:hypothetical protein
VIGAAVHLDAQAAVVMRSSGLGLDLKIDRPKAPIRSAGCATNIDWKKWRHEKQAKTQNDKVFAEHNQSDLFFVRHKGSSLSMAGGMKVFR